MKKIMTILGLAALLTSTQAFADDDQCNTSCPDGQVKVSYLGGGENGSGVDCVCLAQENGAVMPNDNANYGDPDTQSHEYTGE